MRIVKRHWLLLVAGIALSVASLTATVGRTAEASHGGFYYDGWYNWNGGYCTGLFSGVSHNLLMIVYCTSGHI